METFLNGITNKDITKAISISPCENVFTLYRQFWPQGNSGQVGETVPQLLSSFQTFIWLINWSLISLQPTGIVLFKVNKKLQIN